MKKYGSTNLHWEGLEVYKGQKPLGFKVIAVGMDYRIQWPDGVISQDHYNLTRAKDHCIKLAAESLRLDTHNTIGANAF